jgi:predicted acetyltransferase
MDKDVTLIKEQEKLLLRRLLELYSYDFSEYDNSDLNEFGEYGYSRLDHYWTDNNRFPYLFRIDNNIAGFALVRIDDDNYFSIAEFFILKKYRRKGLGEYFSTTVFDRHKGNWHIGVLNCNEPALSFWEKIINGYSNDKIEVISKKDWDGPIYQFRN